MRLAFAAVLALTTLNASAQTEPTRPLPAFSIPIQGNFRPPQTSAVRATLYAATATGALVAIGYAVDRVVASAIDPLRSSSSWQDAGGIIMALGVIGGPTVGNLSLGAGDDARRALTIKATGLVVGGAAVLIGLGAAVGCAVGGGNDCGAGETLFFVGIRIMVAGVAVGTVYDLVTIPASARWAQRARADGNRVPAEAPRVSVAPGVDLRHRAPVLTLRARL